MSISKNEIRIEYTKGSGPGGQNRQKNETACTITHLETGLKAYCCNERSRSANYKKAMKELEQRLKALKEEVKAKDKKQRRERAIRETKTIRTYDYSRGVVTDHRTGKSASIKDILQKGKLDKLR
jgi:peptide chain release factor 1